MVFKSFSIHQVVENAEHHGGVLAADPTRQRDGESCRDFLGMNLGRECLCICDGEPWNPNHFSTWHRGEKHTTSRAGYTVDSTITTHILHP